ncbi:MAG: hypothetical protein JW821_01440 [Deltaproteobacteria bacterium]|nr:hypothetical protein [Deltaproteobacteria bacterium]
MERKNRYRMRLENCIGTIIDMHRRLNIPQEDEESFLLQFERLEATVQGMDMGDVTERDILMLEQATNALLKEFRFLIEEKDRPLYGKVLH